MNKKIFMQDNGTISFLHGCVSQINKKYSKLLCNSAVVWQYTPRAPQVSEVTWNISVDDFPT